MESRTLEINVISANDLKGVNLFTSMDVYVVVFLSGNRSFQQKTPVDRSGGRNPTWNCPMKFTVAPYATNQNLVFKLRCRRAVIDKDLGEVNLPLKEIFKSVGDGKSLKFVSYQVLKPSGKPKGILNLSYKFAEKSAAGATPSKSDEPAVAYPPPMEPTGKTHASVYPPPPSRYGYPPAQAPPGYGYPTTHAPQGYGYPAVQAPLSYGGYPSAYGYPAPAGYGYMPAQQPPKKNNLGLGMGAGFLGGFLGGLLTGDMVSDAAYDAGYGAGFEACDSFDG